MKSLRSSFVSALTLLPLQAAIADAPREASPLRQGLYAGVAFGVGSLALRSHHLADLPNQRETSGTLSLRAGYAILPSVLFGIQAGGWTKKLGASWYGGENDRVTISNLSAEATAYPLRGRGGLDLYFSAGVGMSMERYRFLDGTMSEVGFNFHAGLGLEKRLSQHLVAGLSVNASNHFTLEEDSDYVNVALGLMWY